MSKNVLVGAIIGGLVVLAGAYFVLPRLQTTVEKIGASPGPDRYNPCETTNGVGKCFYADTFKTSTSTVSVTSSPSATSTPTIIITVTAPTTTAYTLVLAESPIGYSPIFNAATSSGSQGGTRRLAEWVVNAGETPTFIFTATTTPASTVPLFIGPSRYLTVYLRDGGLRFPTNISSTGITGTVKYTFDTN